ncbi:hypothetical protein [Paludisphaera rhizosphaerae]|uniref:hypothetical protein n=1 Tax=Paludisphaera rhizosphaerae TaxID=2711216 RepID=UPI0013EE3B23|nr:hypothetical protein [Paludisphaera rhizosphaerae]
MPLQNPAPPIIDPGTLTGIRARYKLSSSGLTAGSITGATIPDLSGNGWDLTVSGSATYNASAINSKGAVVFGGGSAQTDGFFADVPGDWSILCVHRISANVEPWWDGTASFWCRFDSSTPPVQNFAGVTTRATSNSREDGWQSYCGVMDSSSSSPYAGGRYAQDFSAWCSTNAGPISQSDRPLIFCRSGAYELAEWIYFDRALTWGERIAISRYFNSEYGVYSPFVDAGSGLKPFVIAVGNSTTQFPKWPSQLAADTTDVLGGAANLGIAGGMSTTIDQQVPEMTELATALRTLGVPILKIVHHGHNNGFDVIDHFKTSTYSDFRAMGEKLMVSTSTPYNDNDSAEAGRTTLNNWLRRDSGQIADHGDPLDYIDHPVDAFGADYEDPPTDSVMSYVGKYSRTTGTPIVGSRTTYPDAWQDSIHPTELGGGKMAEYIAPFVRAALLDLAGLVDPKTVTTSSTTSTSASLTAPAANGGYGPYTYQWFRDGAAVIGATAEDLNDVGLTSSTAYSYVRRATDSGGFYRESPAVTATTLSSGGTPLSVSLASSAITSTTATVTATPTGGVGTLSYAWTLDGDAVEGETGPVLNLTGLTPSTSYSVEVTVMDSATPTPGTAAASTSFTTSAAGSRVIRTDPYAAELRAI